MQHPEFKARSTSRSCASANRRRHGGAEGGGRELEGDHRRADHRGLRPVGDLADADLQPGGHRRSTPARSAFRCPRPTSRSATTTATKCRSASPAKSARKGPQVMVGYWNRPEETAQVMTADGFFRTGDIGIMDAGRLRQDRRPQEGHDPGLGLQRLSERGRGRDRQPSGRARMRGDRRAGRKIGGSGEGVRRQEGPERHRRGHHQVLRGRSSPATRCRSTSSSAPICRRPTSARSSAARCATRRRNRSRRREPPAVIARSAATKQSSLSEP